MQVNIINGFESTLNNLNSQIPEIMMPMQTIGLKAQLYLTLMNICGKISLPCLGRATFPGNLWQSPAQRDDNPM